MRQSGHRLLAIALVGFGAGTGRAEPPARPPVPVATTEQAGSIPSAAELAVQVLEQGSSTKAIREHARQTLPLAKLTTEHQRLANTVLSDVALFRRLPTIRCPIDARVYQFFVDRPEVAVETWKVLGISRLELKPTGPNTFSADTGDGSTGVIQVLLRTPTQCVVYCDGMFKSPMLVRPIKARALVALNLSFQKQKDGSEVVTHSVDMFVSFPSLTVETIARLVSPLSYKYADRNMEEVTSFVRMMELSMAKQPGWIEQLVLLMDGIGRQRQDEVLKLTAEVYVDAQRRIRAARGESVSLDAIRPPVQTAGGDTGMTR